MNKQATLSQRLFRCPHLLSVLCGTLVVLAPFTKAFPVPCGQDTPGGWTCEAVQCIRDGGRARSCPGGEDVPQHIIDQIAQEAVWSPDPFGACGDPTFTFPSDSCHRDYMEDWADFHNPPTEMDESTRKLICYSLFGGAVWAGSTAAAAGCSAAASPTGPGAAAAGYTCGTLAATGLTATGLWVCN